MPFIPILQVWNCVATVGNAFFGALPVGSTLFIYKFNLRRLQMIDFNGNGFFARLKKVDNNAFGSMINDFLIDNETIIGSYQSIRDGVVFTTKRIIAINVQGLTGKKKDFTSIPYNKITTFSLETAGVFDLDAELEIYMSAVGKVKFEFTGSTNVKDICKIISTYALG
jgi:hypothetical protein